MQLKPEVRSRLNRVFLDIVEDYDEWRQPFSKHGGITMPITNRFETDREKALFLTLTTALNRQRDSERLYSKFGRLWYEEPWIFEPTVLVGESHYEQFVTIFETEGVRFGEKDAQVWYEIARTLYRDYDGNPIRFFEEHDFERSKIEDRVVEAAGDTRFYANSFPVLRGEKVRPTWLRLINNQVRPLAGLDGSDIPVDRHVIGFTSRLVGTEYTDSQLHKERIRGFWQRLCRERSIRPVDVDGPVWYLQRNWEEWGQKYFQRALDDADLELHPDEGVVKSA